MKLERYVLLETKEIWEVNLVDDKVYGFGSGGVVLKNYVDILGNNYKPYSQVSKTSNNILDLVEVGDLVGIPLISNTQLHIEQFKGLEVCQIITLKNRESNTLKRFYINGGAISDDEVVAIYKLQPNGDYKRYEVKK
jgi:hypothetical protein